VTGEESDELARGVMATLEELPARALKAFALGLELSGQPVREFGRAIDAYADDRASPLALILMRRALRLSALDGSLLVLLAKSEEPFWKAVADATLRLAEEMHPPKGTSGKLSLQGRATTGGAPLPVMGREPLPLGQPRAATRGT
jgi:hypothetical protein